MKKSKVIAYYLPQYHELPENNEWWGKGFTEWTNVKKSKPFYEGQLQPRVPLNNNYYDLMDKKTIEWQTELANKYGLYGFCYFHYYFKNGRKILEKPAENLLKWKDINQKFCFFWANIEWRRTWSVVKGVRATNWTEETQKTSKEQGLLLEQDYGKKEDWIAHFNYLLPFFQDERYIRINDMPVFAIYHMAEIPCADEMFETWNGLAKENGLKGIYILSVNEDTRAKINGILHYGGGQLKFSAQYRLINLWKNGLNKLSRLLFNRNICNSVWDYERYWKYILQDKPYGGVPNIPGATVRYDETPRRGKTSFCLKNDSPQLFEEFLYQQLIRGQRIFNTEYLFLDAWNEWGEGNYLEPDTTYGYAYLEALKKAIDRAGEYVE